MTILEMLENSNNVEICYLDFAKEYDKWDHTIMIKKMAIMVRTLHG